MQRYEVKKCIGKGSYGSVYLSKNRDDGRHYVIKRISINDLPSEEREATLQEVRLLASLRNPFIVSYHESFFYNNKEGDEFLCIVMQYCEGGDLNDVIQKQKNSGRLFPEEAILNWFIQILLCLQYIHEKKILHRDLKTKNIFLTKEGRIVKVGDFGIARVLGSTVEMAMTVVGTPYYMSPELCQSKPYSYKSDIWALGCILFELCSLRHAFDANNISGLVYKIMQGSTPAIPQQYSLPLRDLVRKMLSRSPEARPSANAILALPFIKSRAQELCLDMTSFGAAMVAAAGSALASPPVRGVGPAEKAPDPRRARTPEPAGPPPTAASRARTPEAADDAAARLERARLRDADSPARGRPVAKGSPAPQPVARLAPPAPPAPPLGRPAAPEEAPAQRLTPRQLSALRQQQAAAQQPARPAAAAAERRQASPPRPAFGSLEGEGWEAAAPPQRRLHRPDEPLPAPGRRQAGAGQGRGYRSGSDSDGGDRMPGEEVRWQEAAASPAPPAARPAAAPPAAGRRPSGNYSDDEFEAYEDDFEEYKEEEEGERASEVQAAAALLQRAANAPARPQSARDGPSEPQDAVAAQARLVWREKAKNLRARAEQLLGPPLFAKAYEYLRGVRAAGADEAGEEVDEREDQRVRDGLARLVGQHNMGHCFLVDQLIFAEMQYSGAF